MTSDSQAHHHPALTVVILLLLSLFGVGLGALAINPVPHAPGADMAVRP